MLVVKEATEVVNVAIFIVSLLFFHRERAHVRHGRLLFLFLGLHFAIVLKFVIQNL